MTKIIAAAALAMMAAPSQFPADARVRIVEVHSRRNLLLYSGSGLGNVRDHEGVHGFTFTFKHCPQLEPTEGRPLPAEWNDLHRLTLFSRYGQCEMQIYSHDFAYVRNENGQLTTFQPVGTSWNRAYGSSIEDVP